MKTKRILACLLSIAILIAILPTATLTADTVEKTEFVKVNSMDEIVPNARYIIIGTYTHPTTGEVSYHAMGNQSFPIQGYRASYAQDQLGAHNFDISEDLNTITAYSYPDADYDPILKIRLRTVGDYTDRYYFTVDGEGYLCGFSTNTNQGDVGHPAHSCMPIYKNSYSTAGEAWWYMRVVEDGEYAGEWQIVTRCHFRIGGKNVYKHDIMQFCGPYPNSAGQFRANEVYTRDVGEIEDSERIKYTVDGNTNIWIYREVCKHNNTSVLHMNATDASCTNPGNKEYWFCAGCETYSSKADFSDTLGVADIYIPAGPHTESCGHTSETVKFELYTESSMGSNQSGERYLLIGQANGKYYAMGNITNPDGTRNAVEVNANENGIITANSHQAEFVTFDYDNGVFGNLADGGYLCALDGKIMVYDKTLYGTSNYLPYPVSFLVSDWETGSGSFYSYSPMDTAREYMVFDAENLCFRAQSTRSDSTYRYRELCPHAKEYCPETEATCDRCGNVEYWYCDICYKYFGAADGSITLDENSLITHATGHDYTETGCSHCGNNPVYSKVTSEDQLGQPGTYIIVATDGTNTYVLKMPVNMMADLDGNGIPDVEEIDEDGNGVPDIYEKDSDGDGDPDIWDYDYVDPLVIPVTPGADGTISVTGLGAAEFEMIKEDSGLYPENSDAYYFWMPNGLLNGLNQVNTRYACYINGGSIEGADETSVWSISLGSGLTEQEQQELADAKFSVGDENAIMYTENCGTGATRPLRLRIYDGQAYFVTEYDNWLPGATEKLDEYGNVVIDENGNTVYDTNDQQYAVYLYYAAGVGGGAEEPEPGDLNEDDVLNAADALYLLRHTIMPGLYPVTQSADFNGDGIVNSADAIYLLRHIIMPHLYPLA